MERPVTNDGRDSERTNSWIWRSGSRCYPAAAIATPGTFVGIGICLLEGQRRVVYGGYEGESNDTGNTGWRCL